MSKLTEMWPALALALAVGAFLVPVIVHLFKIVLKQFEKTVEKQEASMQKLVDQHERSYKMLADSHERGMRIISDELTGAMKKSSEEQARAVSGIVAQLRTRGR